MRQDQTVYQPGNLEIPVWLNHKVKQAGFMFASWHSQVWPFMQLVGKTVAWESCTAP